ncbi:unnamed protein product [Closterium sp. NIES-53]
MEIDKPAADAAANAAGFSGSSPASDGEQHRRGIPVAQFVADVEAFLAGREAPGVIQSLEERMQQYKLLEIKLLTQKRDLQSKLPDIKKSQEIVQTLVKKREEKQQVRLDYVLADGVFARADVKDADSVCLWLGANVMVEYPFDEALALLARNEENATSSLGNIDGDLLFVRDQINITEVLCLP